MKNINWKKFIIAFIISIPLVLLLDILYDKIFKQLIIWSEIFAADNLFFKIATAAVMAYFYATLYKNEKNS